MEDIMKDFTKQLKRRLLGKKIVAIRYMSDKEKTLFGWHSKPLIIILDDNTFLIPQADDEGNDGGALAMVNGQEFNVIPVTY
jgi:hypothetical protein